MSEIIVESSTASETPESSADKEVVTSEVDKKEAAPNEDNESLNGESDENIADENSDDSSNELEDTAEGESAEGSEDNEEEKIEAKPKKKNGFKKRIDKLNSKLSAKDQELEYWKNEALKQQQAEREAEEIQETSTTDYSASTDNKPDAEDYETHEDYIEALTDWKIDKRDAMNAQKQNENRLKTEHQQRVESHLKRVDTFASRVDDFEDVINSVDDINMPPVVQDIILRSENGPELMYELSKNRDDLEAICKMSPIESSRAIGRFEAKLSKSSNTQTTKNLKTTSAPKPASPLSGRAHKGTAKSPYEPGISFDEYKRRRQTESKQQQL